MLPTIRQILAVPVLATADPEVVAGEDQLDRPVRWLHPAEIDDIAHLLRGDEMVLTTGLFLPEEAAATRTYVASLIEAGVAGLIVELGRRWAVAPEPLVAACRELRLTLIVLHREVRFAAVVEEIGGRILEAQVEDLRATEHIHETFTRLDLEAAEPDHVLAAVVRIAGAPVVLESARHQVIGYDAAGRDPNEVLSDWSRLSRSVPRTGRTSYDRRSGWLMTVVGSKGDDWGRLVLITDGLPSRRDYVLVERAAAALALHQMRARARDSVERNTHTTLLGELRAGRMSPELVSRCESAEFPVKGRLFVALTVRPRTGPSATRQWGMSDVGAVVAGTGRSLRLPMLVGLDTDHVVCLLSLPSRMSVDTVMTRLTHEIRKVAGVVVARGEVVSRLDDTFRTLIDARSILAAADAEDERPWITLADVHLRGLLHLLRDDERLSVYVHRELGPLMAHDTERGTALVALLETYLSTPGGKAAAAKSLLLSRPVLYERLAKIESILGVDLEDPHIRTSLHLAVLAKDVLDDEPSAGRDDSDRS